ncbi:MAG: hypothetical protein KDD44_02455, partial [Bdellovibrionales bacterium]|nr:hypothetical protein [Bdellovibrionales bacterium]
TREQLELEINGEAASSRSYHGGTRGKKPGNREELSPADARLVEDLQKVLGTKVEIRRKPGAQEQGKMTLEFYSADDLDEIYRRLMKFQSARELT